VNVTEIILSYPQFHVIFEVFGL